MIVCFLYKGTLVCSKLYMTVTCVSDQFERLCEIDRFPVQESQNPGL